MQKVDQDISVPVGRISGYQTIRRIFKPDKLNKPKDEGDSIEPGC